MKAFKINVLVVVCTYVVFYMVSYGFGIYCGITNNVGAVEVDALPSWIVMFTNAAALIAGIGLKALPFTLGYGIVRKVIDNQKSCVAA